jgi:hypothetical protein
MFGNMLSLYWSAENYTAPKETPDRICNLRDLVPIQKPCAVGFVETITLLILYGQNSETTDASAAKHCSKRMASTAKIEAANNGASDSY